MSSGNATALATRHFTESTLAIQMGVRGENPPTPIEQSGSIGVFVVGLQVDLENWHPVPELRISLQLRLENARVENPGQENPVFGIEIKTTEYIQ
jgi:hypothetical protein